MSVRTDVVYGLGFEVEDIKTVNVLRFLSNHKDTLLKVAGNYPNETVYGKVCEFLKLLKKENIFDEGYAISDELEESLASISDEDDDAFIGLDFVSDIIDAETDFGVTFERGQSYDGCRGCASILIPLDYPWGYTRKYINTTRDTVESVLGDYAEELGLPRRVEDLEIEYFG